jgi:hypothetical protein
MGGSYQTIETFFAPVSDNQAVLFTGNDISSLQQGYYYLQYTVINYYGAV